MDEFTLIDNIKRICKSSALDVYDRMVRLIRGSLKGTTYALDSTIIRTKPNFPGCGMTKREKENRPNDPPETIYGFKLFVLYEIKSRIITAIDIVPVNESDSNYFLAMIKKGIRNCGKDKIKLVIADRGFLDGANMWELKHNLGVDFIIPAKSNMDVHKDATGLRKIYTQSGRTVAKWPYGKSECEGYGVNNLLSYMPYNPPNVKDNSSTTGSPINAVVITTWRGKPITPGKETVLLTSLPAEEDVLAVACGYRQRSLIENCGFRELKQAAYLQYLPHRTGEMAENAAYLHIMLCVFAHTLFYAFICSRKKEIPKSKNGDCLRAFRRKEFTSIDKRILIIAKEKYYALFSLNELFDILDVKQKHKLEMRC